MKTSMLFLALGFMLVNFEFRHGRMISGKVTDEAGSPFPGVNVLLKGAKTGTVTDSQGTYAISVPVSGETLVFSFIGYHTQEIRLSDSDVVDVQMQPDVQSLEEVAVTGYGQARSKSRHKRTESEYTSPPAVLRHQPSIMRDELYVNPDNTEEYDGIEENIFYGADKKPLSTFSIDVDAAAYSNARRFINNGQLPPRDAVRTEEMINYFDYEYQEPVGRHPVSIYSEIGPAPWNEKHLLVHLGLQGKSISVEDLPPSNLVFLVDVSGSMNVHNKLPLVKKSFEMLIDQLRPEDRVAIVVYAGAVGVVLEPTPGSEKRKISAAIQKLQAGGSTAGGAGLRMAYTLAKEHYNEKANNRIILATDGDFNVGESSNKAMEDLIEEKRKEGIFLTVLGYGMGNLKDSKMELLADKGNGNYAYIDNVSEARKVFIDEFAGTLFTIAKDVKLQVEFNPSRVQAYRLIGYENRKLNDEDFNNDRKDAGDLGSGHTVTALYEVIPVGVRSEFYAIDDLKYQPRLPVKVSQSTDWLTVKLRYKAAGDDRSIILDHGVSGNAKDLTRTSNNFRWSAAVAAFGMVLAESAYHEDYKYEDIISLAQGAKGDDSDGHRAEFINLVRTSSVLSKAASRR